MLKPLCQVLTYFIVQSFWVSSLFQVQRKSSFYKLRFKTFLQVSVSAILSDLKDRDSATVCSINGQDGVCTYNMLCTFAGGTHLGTCRDRFIFGSCCRLPPKKTPTGKTLLKTSLIERMNDFLFTES